MKKKSKVLLIGWDAADWKVIGPLLAKGQMPALKKLIDKGVYGNMSTMNPPYSPMLWSTVATGKTPDKHGVLGFIEVIPDQSGIRPVTVNSRKSKAIWNILHHKGYKSNLVGWWPSFPAEPINGVVVSDKFQKVNKSPKESSPIAKGTIHPETLTKDLHDLRMFPYEINEQHILPFIPKASKIDVKKDKGLESFSKVFAENTSVHAAATNLMRTTEWDFMAVYYDFIDHLCHGFMKFYPPKLNGIPEGQFEIYNEVVVSAYRYQDMMLQRKMDLADDDTTIIVMSDHGFESDHKRILKMPKYPAAPALEHRQFGIFVAAGPNIKKNEKVFGLTLMDIAPTILNIFDLPIGKDMDGKVALDIFENPVAPKFIDSWEALEGDFGQHKTDSIIDELSAEETMKQLVDLGYIDKPDEKVEIAVLKTKCDLKHNLARVYLGKKDYKKANELLAELINDTYPIYSEAEIKVLLKKNTKGRVKVKAGDSVVDVIPFYMDLLSIALIKKDFIKADVYLQKLRSLDEDFKLNTYFAESKILLGKGQVDQALKILLLAKNNKPNSEVWFQIGKIYMQTHKYEAAKEALLESLKLESDNAKTQQAIAETYLRLGDYEEAADHAFISIELVKYFPEAHYTLGEALEKLGDIENAKEAYETSKKLRRKTDYRTDQAIENVKEKLLSPLDLKDKSDFKYRDNQIVVVSGLPRSGTSLMMQMLDSTGLDILTDKNRIPDASNPKGYFEYDPVMSIHKDNSWLEDAQNKTVKIVAPLLKYLNPKYRYKIIFMNRDLHEIIKSQQKMTGKDTDVFPVKLMDGYKQLLHQIEIWKDKFPNVELVYVNYKDVLNDTETVLDKVIPFIGIDDLDREAMAKCVDKSLYRNKVEK